MAIIDRVLHTAGLQRIERQTIAAEVPVESELWPFYRRATWANERVQIIKRYGILQAAGLKAIWEAQEGCCPYTGETLPFELAHVEHIIPLSTGGLNVLGNVVFVIGWANSSKCDRSLKQWCELKSLDYKTIHSNIQEIHRTVKLQGFDLM